MPLFSAPNIHIFKYFFLLNNSPAIMLPETPENTGGE